MTAEVFQAVSAKGVQAGGSPLCCIHITSQSHGGHIALPTLQSRFCGSRDEGLITWVKGGTSEVSLFQRALLLVSRFQLTPGVRSIHFCHSQAEQSTNGTGALIPGVTVTATNNGTGVATTV